jgi:ferric-dicitrate binding protein FerR (iron transport regulator)
MKDRFTTRLTPGQALTLDATRAPRRLVVTSGRLWLTVTGGCDDHWLAAGEGLTLAAGQQAVVEAWPQASFQLLQPAPERARSPAWTRRMTPAAA